MLMLVKTVQANGFMLINRKKIMSYDRYSRFRVNGKITKVPSVSLTEKSTDYFEVYKRGISRLDNISYKYYDDPSYDWLIMMANPEYGSMEFSIPDNALLRIPFPLGLSIEDYVNRAEDYITLYGLD